MSPATKVKAKIVFDSSGVEGELPVLLTDQGMLEPLLAYLLAHQHDRSDSWMERVVHVTYLLMQYLEANESCFDDPRRLLQSFAQRLYVGTIGDDGLDPSGLYWLPASTRTVNGLIAALAGLTDWLVEHRGVRHMNLMRKADSFERRLSYTAWFRRNQHDFLGHIQDRTITQMVSTARNLRGRRSTVVVHDDAIAFPERLFPRFFRDGLGGVRDRRAAVRNQLIVILMHFAGCRESDALHLWIEDVLVDPQDAESVIIRLYHPEEGKAPNGWRGRAGATHRAAYLRERYALTPRNRLRGTKRVGWKYTIVDHKDKYIQLYWFPREAGILFAKLWREYLLYLVHLDRHHPYAFVSFEPRHLGEPLTLNAFNDAYTKALLRIGEGPAKVEGLSPHAHRHAMGRRLEKADLNPRLIQKVLHHRSLTSQEPYTAPGIDRVTQALNAAYRTLEHKKKTTKVGTPLPHWNDLLRHGFADIDPDGLFSGAAPKLRRNSS